jgi:hypothetical protein
MLVESKWSVVRGPSSKRIFSPLNIIIMNTNAKDPGNGGCCGGLEGMGCC